KDGVVLLDGGDRLLARYRLREADQFGIVLPHKLADGVAGGPGFDERLLRLYVVRKLPAFDRELQAGPPWLRRSRSNVWASEFAWAARGTVSRGDAEERRKALRLSAFFA